MEIVKSFLSHILSIIFFVAVMFLSVTIISKEVLNHNTVYNALEESGLLEEALKNNETLKNAHIPEELLDYVEIDDIVYNYVTDKFLFEAKVISEEPTIDRKLLNERLGNGLEKYIDEKINKYTGGISSLLKDAGIDLGLEDKVKEYIENNTSIDLTNNEIVKEKDLEAIYKYADDVIADVREDSFAFEIIEVLIDGQNQMLAIAIMVGSLLLIALINFNIASLFAYSIAPLIIASIIFILLYFASSFINFSGSFTASIINFIIDKVGILSFKYFMVFLLLAIFDGLFYYIVKHLSILISHRRGVTTLDTVFDDYNSEAVVQEINSREEAETKAKKKKKTKKTKKKKEGNN